MKLGDKVHLAGCSHFTGEGEPEALYGQEGQVYTVTTEDASQSDMKVVVRFPFYVNPSVTKRYIECSLHEVRCSSALLGTP